MTHPQIDTLDPKTATLTLSLDVGLYPRDVLYAAAYVFIDRAYVRLDRDGSRYLVHLRGKQALDETTLRAMAGEFGNELLSQVTRLRLSQATARIREFYTAAALRAAASAPSVDELLAELESEELLEDPLEIMVPWEETHGTKQNESESK